jgi:hypothetical protein
MVVIKSAFLKKNIEEMVVQTSHFEQSLFNYFISNIITFNSTSPKNGKKQKTVKFSGVNQVYLIHTIDEIKEFLPDMYWKYDIQTDNDDYIYKNVEKDFLPLTRKMFVYEKIIGNDRIFRNGMEENETNPPIKYPYTEINRTEPPIKYPHTEINRTEPPIKYPHTEINHTEQAKATPIIIPNYLYSTTTPPNYLSKTTERNTPPSKRIFHLSTNYMFRDKVASCIFNTACFDTNNRNDDVFKENTNSLPLTLNELGIDENIVFSYPLHSSKYKLLTKDKIPSMFDGIQCHVKV